jgi:hypothetical protein
MMRFMGAIVLIAIMTGTADANNRKHHIRVSASYDSGTIIGGRPAGCPVRYCGCGARLYLGINDIRLNLAANWPRYYKGNRMIAVWSHHVALVERMTGPNEALLRDYNSGGGLSRLHIRNISGARIINRGYAAL